MRTAAAAATAAAWAVAALSAATWVAPVSGWASSRDICEVEGVALANGSYAEALFQATVSDATTLTWLVWYNRTARREPGRRATTTTSPPQQRQPNDAFVVVWRHDASLQPDQAELARTGGCPPLSGAADPALRVAGYDRFMSACQVEPSSSPAEETVTCLSVVAQSMLDDGARLVFGLSVCDSDVTGAVRYFVRVADAYSVSSCPQQDSPLALIVGAALLAAGALLLVVAGACLLARRRRRRDAAAAPEERVELRAAT